MATINVTINAKGSITGVTQVERGFERLQDSAKKTKEAVDKSLNINVRQHGLGKLAGTIGEVRGLLGAGIAGAGLVAGIKSAIDKSVQLENALLGLNSVARSAGIGFETVQLSAIELSRDGLIPVSEVAQGLKNLLSSGLGLEQSIKLFNGLKDTAAFNRQSFYTLGQAVVATTEGIKNGNSVLADAVGTTENLSVMQRRYAESLGTTVDKLTDGQKAQAAYLGFLKDSARFQGDAAKVAGTYQGAVSRLNAQFDVFLSKVGKAITDTGILQNIINKTAGTFERFAAGVGDQTIDKRISELNDKLQSRELNSLGGQEGAYAKRIRGEIALLEEEKRKIEQVTAAQSRNAQLEKESRDRAEQQKKKDIEARDKAKRAYEALKKEFANFGKTELESLQKVRDQKLKDAGNDTVLRLQIEQKYQQDLLKLEEDTERKRLQRLRERARLEREVRESFAQASANPFGDIQMPEALRNPQNKREQGLRDRFDRNVMIGRGIGVAGNALEGAQGAKNLIGGLAAGGLDMIAPGLGQAAGPLIAGLMEGPEHVKQMVREFAQAVPDVIQALVEAIPVFVEELALQLPIIVERLADKADEIILALVRAIPKVATALAKAMPQISMALVKAMPDVAAGLISGLIKEAPKFIEALVRGVGDAIKKFLGLGGDNPVSKVGGGIVKGAGGVLSSVTKGTGKVVGDVVKGVGDALEGAYKSVTRFLGFAKGGEVPPGYPNDNFPARLTSGEIVVDRSTTSKLKQALDGGGIGGNEDILMMILQELRKPFSVESSVTLDQRAFANIVLELSRTKQRMA